MFFLCSDIRCTLKVFGGCFALEPVTYPKVNLKHILVAEKELGHLVLSRFRHIKTIKFDYRKLPKFPRPLKRLDDVRENQKIILLRGGGIGDLLMFSPVLKVLKDSVPASTTITMATFKERHPLFQKNPYARQLVELPVRMADFTDYDYYIDFCGREDTLKGLNMTDYFLSYLGLSSEDNIAKGPQINESLVDCPTILRAFEMIGRRQRPVVFFNAGASDIIRALPPGILEVLSANFPDVLFVVPSLNQNEVSSAGNIIYINTFESLEAYITAVKCSDAVVSSDSAAYHIAAALNKPGLVFFGPIASRFRSLYYPSIISLNSHYHGTRCKAPCGLDKVQFSDKQRPDGTILKTGVGSGCPEAKIQGAGYSPCLMWYSKEIICTKFSLLLSRLEHKTSHWGQLFQLMP